MTYVSRPVPSPEKQKAYSVTHASGCWGCHPDESLDWEVVHCPCCIEQWIEEQ